jgi:putative DNA primase/helicase
MKSFTLSSLAYELTRSRPTRLIAHRHPSHVRQPRQAQHNHYLEIALFSQDSSSQHVASSHLSDVIPWDTPVDMDSLLCDIEEILKRILVLPDGGAVAITLWTALSHVHDAAGHSPILAFVSPTKGSGKTTALGLIHALAPRALTLSNASAASVYRFMRHRPTLCIDEIDILLAQKDQALTGILNGGHTRAGAKVLRVEGEGFVPTVHSTWGAKAVASIGDLPPTIQDRSIVVRLPKKKRTEHREKLSAGVREGLAVLSRKLARWGTDNYKALESAVPNVPELMDDRAQDNWRLMLAIADNAGGQWPAKARDAAVRLSQRIHVDLEDHVHLLADLKDLVESWAHPTIPSGLMVEYLQKLEESRWKEDSRGRCLTAHRMANLLGKFGIRSRDFRPAGQKTMVKGYLASEIVDAIQRYVPAHADEQDEAA